MAYAYGTVTDYKDFFTKLLAYAAGGSVPGGWTGGTVSGGEVWTVHGSINASLTVVDTVFLVGQGSEAGDNITIGLQTYNTPASSIYGVQIQGYTVYDSSLGWNAMPGASPIVDVALSGSSFDAWFYVNGRRIMAVARTGGIYDICFYMGFMLPYCTHAQYPYPLLISGSVDSTAVPVTQNDLHQSCIPDPVDCYFYWIDGTWQNASHYAGGATVYNSYGLYPMKDVTTYDGGEMNTDSSVNGQNYSYYSEVAMFQAYASGVCQFGTSEIGMYPAFPTVLSGATKLQGQIDG